MNIQHMRQRRIDIDMSARTIAALAGGKQSRIPEDQRNADVFLVQPATMSDRLLMRVAKRFAMIAGDDDDRVVSEIAMAQRREQSSQMSIGLSQRVQVSLQQFAIGSFVFIEKVDRLRVLSQSIGMMRLIGPLPSHARPRRTDLVWYQTAIHKRTCTAPPPILVFCN